MIANATVGGRIEEGSPEQCLSFRFGPVRKDLAGVECAVRVVRAQRLFWRPNGASAGQGEGEGEALRAIASPRL